MPLLPPCVRDPTMTVSIGGPVLMQRISVAVQLAAASEIRLAMGVGQATAVA